MVRPGIVRAVRLHHRNRAKVEVRIAMRAALGKLLNYFRCLTNCIPMNSLLVGGNQIRSNVDFGKNLDEQRCGGRIVAVVEHRGSDIETFLWSGLSQLADELDSIRRLHASGVLRKRLSRDSPAATFEAGPIQGVLRRCQKFLRFLNPRGIVARINFNKRSDSADPRSDLGRRSSRSIGSTRHNHATQNQNAFTHSSYLAEHGVGFHLDPSVSRMRPSANPKRRTTIIDAPQSVSNDIE